ncbi:hypothetical protein AJ80_06683 [Polytolypa hystricis UAMH7299]|uniref:Uncharacterized protein n=1 Tax=Polytolypa hystricis (strain UAMH7299) TaxID=1447883 RepID=A0A2B7XV68_POLH7|nr:hypothetical protein AJ80_06683 [Polytolypa hystricis UAMH7299]
MSAQNKARGVAVKDRPSASTLSKEKNLDFYYDVTGGGSDDDYDSEDEPMPKDETEEKLEKLLFGDTAGFHSALKDHEVGSTELVRRKGTGEDSDMEISGDEEGDLADVDDADLFFLDAGNADAVEPILDIDGAQSGKEAQLDGYHEPAAAWEDSDDERITVSLAGHSRLRKLRATEAEDVVSGKEYVRRLRKQFERLQAAPQWATTSGTRSSKRRKTGSESGDEVTTSMDEMDTDEDEEQEMSLQPLARLLQNAGDLTRGDEPKLAGGKRKLRQEVLDIQRMKDVGGNQPSSIDSLSFHPHHPLLLSSGPASTLFLHHVSPHSASPNPLLTSLHIRRTPLHTSAFSSPTGNRIFFAGRRRYFHIWDLDTGKVEKVNGTADRKEEQKTMERFKPSPCGRWIAFVGSTKKGGGVITIMDATTLQWIAHVRIDSAGGVADFAWWSDGEGMCVVGKNGEVNEWDGREKRIIARWMDEGAVGITVLSLGGKSGRSELGGDRWVAIGSSSGIVNIYDRRPWAMVSNSKKKQKEDLQAGIPRHPKPARMLDQLTTPTSYLVFSNDGQLLVMASRWKRDALRLIHLPSCTVYRNWPTSNTPFGRITAVAIAPTSNMLAVANEQGKIRLWEIHG